MNEELQKFIEWIPQNIEEMKDKTPDEVVEVLNNLGQSNEGKKMIETWMSKFKSSTAMFKDGGKMEYLVNMFKCGGKPKCKSKSKCGSKYKCGGKCKIKKGEDGLEAQPIDVERFGEIKSDNRNDFQRAMDDARTLYKTTPFFNSPVWDAIATTAATAAGGAAINKIAKLAKAAYMARAAKLSNKAAQKAKDAATLSGAKPGQVYFYEIGRYATPKDSYYARNAAQAVGKAGNQSANFKEYLKNAYNIGNNSKISSIKNYSQNNIGNLDWYMRGSDFDIDGSKIIKRLNDIAAPIFKYETNNSIRPLELIVRKPEFIPSQYIIKNTPINWNAVATGAAGLGALLGLEKIREDASNARRQEYFEKNDPTTSRFGEIMVAPDSMENLK